MSYFCRSNIFNVAFDIKKIRSDFPILKREVYGKPLAYLDNAATTQKPQVVIDRIAEYYSSENCNIHRGVHYLSLVATTAFEEAREHVARFLNVADKDEIVFTKGTTESVNLVATALGRNVVNKDDEVLITGMEHHSNLVPWQMLCHERKAKLRVVPFNDRGEIDLHAYERMLGPRTRIVALAHVSNALGTINPVKEMISLAHKQGVPVLIDGAQAISHLHVDVTDLDCDFYCFSGHKVYAPMGVGVLYAKKKHLESMAPYQTGGEMVDRVSFFETTFNEVPFKFEAGTPNVEAVLGLDAALTYIEEIGIADIAAHEADLLAYGTCKLKEIEGLQIYGTASEKTGVLSFTIGDIHPYDAGTIIDRFGVAVRTGHHCAQPVMDHYGIPGTVRASFAIYNTKEEIDQLVVGIRQAIKMFNP
jgi:cysteine desulfurase/selenocysteine lyase